MSAEFPTIDFGVNEVYLERMLVAATGKLSRHLSMSVASQAEFAAHLDRITDALVVQLRSYVLSNRLEETTATLEARFPTSPWQRHKDCCFSEGRIGRWWLRRWPVRWHVARQEHTFELSDTYPEAEIALPREYGRPHRIAVLTSQEPIKYTREM